MEICSRCGIEKTNDNTYTIAKWKGKRGLSSTCKKCQSKIVRDRNFRIKEEVISLLGGKCYICGYSDRRALQIDHIHGNGINERKITNYYSFRRKLLKLNAEELTREYQLLCANCNQIKRIEKENWTLVG